MGPGVRLLHVFRPLPHLILLPVVMGAYRFARHLCRCVLEPLLAAPADVVNFPGRDDNMLVLSPP
eukprot:4047121-Heterocapsa_arctica.AAC.1